MSDWDSDDQKQASCGTTKRTRANTSWKQLLADYEHPPLDPPRLDAVDDYFTNPKAERGAPKN